MIDRLTVALQNKLPAGSFARNVIILISGTTFAQAIPIAISPILTRIYSPEDFGILALFVSIAAILGSIANGRYELAIVLPVKDEEAINVVGLCIIIAAVFSLVLLVLILILHDFLVLKLGNPAIGLWLYFLPLVVLLIGLFNALTYFNIRTKKFKDIAKANVNKSVATAVTQLALGFARSGSVGLVSGQIMSYITGNTVLCKNILREKELLKSIEKREIKRLAKRYIDFPEFSMWSILANTLAYNLVNIFISYKFGAAILGFYSLGNRVLGAPASLVGISFGQVFFQKAMEEKNRNGSATNIFLRTSKILFFVGLPLFILLYFILEDLFAFVFGAEWRIAGTYARILLPLFFVQFYTTPLSNINNIFEKQKIALLWQISLLFVTLAIMSLAQSFHYSITTFLLAFSHISSVLYLVLWLILLKISKGDRL